VNEVHWHAGTLRTSPEGGDVIALEGSKLSVPDPAALPLHDLLLRISNQLCHHCIMPFPVCLTLPPATNSGVYMACQCSMPKLCHMPQVMPTYPERYFLRTQLINMTFKYLKIYKTSFTVALKTLNDNSQLPSASSSTEIIMQTKTSLSDPNVDAWAPCLR
jgi:hypothetical protein